ncbi:hypothetical protein [Jiella sp. M17.18]|uniref:hypothetical protein n=1 Tax=Jiella sp. M17.18 TaxID=3234247 RepID=UPI0034E03D31
MTMSKRAKCACEIERIDSEIRQLKARKAHLHREMRLLSAKTAKRAEALIAKSVTMIVQAGESLTSDAIVMRVQADAGPRDADAVELVRERMVSLVPNRPEVMEGPVATIAAESVGNASDASNDAVCEHREDAGLKGGADAARDGLVTGHFTETHVKMGASRVDPTAVTAAKGFRLSSPIRNSFDPPRLIDNADVDPQEPTDYREG